MSRLLLAIFRSINSFVVSVIAVAAILFAGVWAKEQAAKIGDYQKSFNEASSKVGALEKRIEEMRLGRDPFSVAYRRALITEQSVTLERDSLVALHPVKVHVPGTQAWQRHGQLKVQVSALQGVTRAAELAAQTERRAIQASLVAAKEAQDEAYELLENAREWEKALPYLKGAIVVVAFAILSRFAIKILLYFVAAPWAARRPPIQILPDLKGNVRSVTSWPNKNIGSGPTSSVSVAVVVDGTRELLVQNGHVQSASLTAKKHTRWLLNWSIPYSSLLSGLYGLTCIQSETPETIVITASEGTLAEVSIIDLSEGAGFVCHPRSLIGIIQSTQKPIRISRHWRLGSLQAWLTLQLRALVFHGPGQLIVEGGRGVRAESGRQPRYINQAATIGFSANLSYSNTRCETFLTYLTGKDELFNDSFAGSEGLYIYEEAPNRGKSNGITGRGFEGILDGCLKAVGI